MNARNCGIAVLVAASMVAFAGGCNNNKSTTMDDETKCKEVKPGTVTSANKVCVMVNEDPVNPSVEPAVWKGQKVGFCCNGCKPKWAKLSDAQKDAALAKAIAASH